MFKIPPTIEICFIDKETYTSALKNNVTQKELLQIACKDHRSNLLSVYTNVYIYNLNYKLKTSLFGEGKVKQNNHPSIVHPPIDQSILSDVNTYIEELIATPPDLNSLLENKKYYEIIASPENAIFVVFQKGFIQHLVESKESYLKFLLSCLHHLYNLDNISKDILSRLFLFNKSSTDIKYLKLSLGLFS